MHDPEGLRDNLAARGSCALAGRLANALPYDESTLGLSLWVKHRESGQVPHFVFAPDVEHALAEEERHGIAWIDSQRSVSKHESDQTESAHLQPSPALPEAS
jgi:hypothetical protein